MFRRDGIVVPQRHWIDSPFHGQSQVIGGHIESSTNILLCLAGVGVGRRVYTRDLSTEVGGRTEEG